MFARRAAFVAVPVAAALGGGVAVAATHSGSHATRPAPVVKPHLRKTPAVHLRWHHCHHGAATDVSSSL
jgi:hypothetical protein